jgi:mercuric ion transport protein
MPVNRRVLLGTGVIGSAVVGVCCFTPVLVLFLTGLGLSAAIGWLDWMLLPMLAFFLLLTLYALWARGGRQ